MPDAVTAGVRVTVDAEYHAEHSNPGRREWFFSYRVHIKNESSRAVQLLNRHWVITDSAGERQEVRGPGVVGEQPILAPGEVFSYTSFCPLSTSLGAMHGTYAMRRQDGEMFDVQIPAFALVDPSTEN
ncbi:MAG: Co2+/Mg2+ efflux protein ApaG [Myxococcota bacterium]